MKVPLIKEKTIIAYMNEVPKSRAPFQDWLSKIDHADWKTPLDIKKTYGTADLLGNASHRVVFDIGGNNYSMICKYAFGENEVHLFVCWIGTHKKYDDLCDDNLQYEISKFLKTMETLKYKVIISEGQYDKYCLVLEELVFSGIKSKHIKEEIDLITLLIEKWDEEHRDFHKLDPVELIHSLMNDHKMKARDLVELLEISKGYVSDILNYKKGLSKEVIRKLAKHFKLSQEAFNRNYALVSEANRGHKDEKMMNTTKKLQAA